VLEENNAIAGSPQDPNLRWTHLRPSQVSEKLAEKDLDLSPYLVGRIYEYLNLRRRKMSKSKTMKQIAHRDEQFQYIAQLIAAFLEAGLPVLSLDTKKKEMLGEFYRPGYGYGTAALAVNDHDFASFSTGVVIPHGLYDVGQNRGYLTLGVSKDTSAFLCDNLQHFWLSDLQWHYPEAEMALLLCDGGGSNNARHYLVKQDLYRLAQELEITLVVAHYPAYCSKWNPIEHRMFCHVSRSWEGACFSNIELVKALAEQTSTQTGLEVEVWVNRGEYATGRRFRPSFKEKVSEYIDFSDHLPKWNYSIHPNIL